MRHLYLQIYLAFLAIGAAAVLTVLVVARLYFTRPVPPASPQLLGVAALLAERLPPNDPPERTRAALRELGDRLHLGLVLWDMSGGAIATPGFDPPPAREYAPRRANADIKFGRVVAARGKFLLRFFDFILLAGAIDLDDIKRGNAGFGIGGDVDVSLDDVEIAGKC